MMDDLISRQAAIDAVCMEWCGVKHQDCKHPFDAEKDDYYWCDGCATAMRILPDLPPAQSEADMVQKGEPMNSLNKDDFGTLAICAIRYCHGRQTYMHFLVRWIVEQHLSELSDEDLNVMIEDCAFQERFHMYGDERIDKPGWLAWKDELIAERGRREQ